MYYNYNYRGYPNNDNRFVFPFLLGGLAGGALVGVTRPRPVYVNSYQPYPIILIIHIIICLMVLILIHIMGITKSF